VAGSKDGEKQKKKNLVKGRWREDLEPLLTCELSYTILKWINPSCNILKAMLWP
jgi:hypothetical protein